MAFEFLGSGNSATSSIGATFTGGESVLVVVWNGGPATGGVFTCSDGVNTYVSEAQRTISFAIALFKANAVAAGTVTITTTGGFAVAFFRYRGLAAGSAQVAITGQNTPGGSSAADSVFADPITPLSAPALVFAAFGKQNGGKCQPGTEWIDRGPMLVSNYGVVQDRRVLTVDPITARCNTGPDGSAFFEGHQFVVAVFSEAAGTFARPSSDIATTGWKPRSGSELFANVDEDYAETGEFDCIQGPDLAGSLTPATFGLSTTLATGTHSIRIRARRTASTGDARVLLLDSGGATVGTSSWQTLSAAFVNYTFSVTTTGTAARASIEVRP